MKKEIIIKHQTMKYKSYMLKVIGKSNIVMVKLKGSINIFVVYNIKL